MILLKNESCKIKKGYSVSQYRDVLDLLTKTDMYANKPSDIPIEIEIKSENLGKIVDKKR